MGKQWDRLESSSSKYGRSQSAVDSMKGLYGDAGRARARQHDWHLRWLSEAYRVLSSGGVIKAFSGTRTFHRLALAMEQAGFEVLPMETWNYGSGFPKSMNIGKVLEEKRRDGGEGNHFYTPPPVTTDFTGWGTALKPSWEPVVVGRKPHGP